MFGKSLIKVFGLAIAGIVALTVGVQILSSAIAIAISFRYGDFLPFLLVTILAMVLLRFPQMLKEGSPFRAVQMVLAYSATAYLVIVVFVLLLPFGVVACIVGSSFTVIFCSVVHDPKEIQRLANDIPLKRSTRGLKLDGGNTFDRIASSEQTSAASRNHVFRIRQGDEKQVIALMRERPLLPMSVTRYESFSVVVVSTGDNRRFLSQVEELLSAAGINYEARLSPLFLDAILKLPLIDAQFGLTMDDFCIVNHAESVEYLLKNWLTRMTVFSTINGPWIILPRTAIPGIAAVDIPSEHEVDMLLLHDYTSIKESVRVGTKAA